MAPRKTNEKNLPATRTAGANLPVKSLTDQMVADSGAGFENVGADDVAIPFLVILQALSPQLRGTARIKGAAEGDIFNTVTQEVIKGDIFLIPCFYEKSYVEWRLRENGGGFVQKYHDPSILSKCKRDDRKRDMLANGNQVVTTAYHYCLYLKDNGETEPVVLGLSSTQLKKSRRWNSTMLSLKMKTPKGIITPPAYSHVYTTSVVDEENDTGSWKGWNFGNPERIEDVDLYQAARKFHDDISHGNVKVSVPPPSDGTNDVILDEASNTEDVF